MPRCPRCRGMVLNNYGDCCCLNCGWRPAELPPVKPKVEVKLPKPIYKMELLVDGKSYTVSSANAVRRVMRSFFDD